MKIEASEASVESSFLLRQRFTPRQLSKDNRPIVLLLFLMFPHAKDIWRNIHVFQRGSEVDGAGCMCMPKFATEWNVHA